MNKNSHFRRAGRIAAWTAAGVAATFGQSAQAQLLFSGAGADAATAVGAFRAAMGGVNNGGAAPATLDQFKGAGRREINWDAVTLNGADFGGNTQVIDLGKTINIPTNRFQARGVKFGGNFAVSGDGFSSVNPDMAGQFPFFSPVNTFASANENIVDMSFVFASAPNTAPIQAGTRGFGAIFLDVELADASCIEYFNGDTLIGKYAVQAGNSGEASFLGVLFDQPVVTSVRLHLGNGSLFNFDGTNFASAGPEDLANGIDRVATDDFFYAEPTTAVPEPSSLAFLLGAGVTGTLLFRRRRARA